MSLDQMKAATGRQRGHIDLEKRRLTQSETLAAQNVVLRKMLEQASLDARARDVAEQIQRVLIHEIHHRMKNMLTMIAVIVRQSMRSADSIHDAETAVDARLLAMSKAHDLLIKENWKSTGLASVIRGATEQHDGAAKRIILQGPEIEVGPSSILPLMLIFNELCTNATKYGALSADSGYVSLSWGVGGEGNSLVIRWVEVDGPPVAPPQKSSFGTRLIENAIPRQLGGRGRLSFLPSGVEFKLVVPLGSEGPLCVGATRSQPPVTDNDRHSGLAFRPSKQ